MRNPTVGFRGNDAQEAEGQIRHGPRSSHGCILPPYPAFPHRAPPIRGRPLFTVPVRYASLLSPSTQCRDRVSSGPAPPTGSCRCSPALTVPSRPLLTNAAVDSHRQPPPRSAAQLPLSASPMQQWPAIPPPPPPVPLPLARQPFGGPLGALYLRPGPPTALPSLPLSASQALPTAALPSAALPQGDDVDPMPCCCPPPINGPPTAGAGNRARPSG